MLLPLLPPLLLLSLLLLLPPLAATTSLNTIQAAIIQQIAPTSASCPPNTTECRTAHQAAPFIFRALTTHHIHHPNLQAAVIALMAYESADFRYKHNVWPGRPGQGTANMQMPRFNLLYARRTPALRATARARFPFRDPAGQSPDTLDAILALVTPDEYNFGSGPWFLAEMCGGDVRAALARDLDQGFGLYMACVGVDVSLERRVYLERAKRAFGLA
ncbi:hypothetical protein E4U42_007706 [Claviceps africana]|uniref:Uncharacterized protein n=1 Tax=Claviceps africana TaxID=83212 RepID=A0A8K0NIC7_9HYPO|nr:hypothetical protein E4U42_007706 [Claviceps africana]